MNPAFSLRHHGVRIIFAALAATGLASCVSTDPYSYGPSYYDSGYYSRPYNSYYYGSGYYHDHDHDDHHDNHHRGNDEKYKLVGGSQRNKPDRPEGWHTAEWYKQRGYNVHNYTVKDKDGDVVHKQHKSGSSSSKHSDSDKKSENHKKH